MLLPPWTFSARALPAMALAMALSLSPAAAADKGEAEAPAPATKTKPAPEIEKPDEQAGAKSGKKTAKESGGKPAEDATGKPAEKSDQKPESEGAAEAESKADDPCDPKKQLFPSEFRDRLCKAGIKLGITETSEVLGNFTGGRHQGAIYEGLTDLNLDINFRPTLGVSGEVFARAYQIHGRGLTTTIGSLNEISGIEAAAATRLNELWYEQQFGDWLWLRFGQQTIGTEFLSPETARLFISGAFGWPTLPALDLPSGGPAFPLGTPAIRARIEPDKALSLYLGLFNGDPTGAGVGGSQVADASGTAFRIGDGAFLIGEIRYKPEGSDKNGTLAFGGWWNSERFRDLHLDASGISLVSPFSNGRPRQHDNDYSLFASINRPLPLGDSEQPPLALFARAMGAPGDRNLIDLYVDGGLAYKGPFGRADDQVGIAVGYARVGSAARAFDADVARFGGISYPVRSGETLLELTYQFQLTQWWQVQPDFQYIFNPGGGVPSLSNPTRRVGDAAVLGVRTAITF